MTEFAIPNRTRLQAHGTQITRARIERQVNSQSIHREERGIRISFILRKGKRDVHSITLTQEYAGVVSKVGRREKRCVRNRSIVLCKYYDTNSVRFDL